MHLALVWEHSRGLGKVDQAAIPNSCYPTWLPMLLQAPK